MATFVQAPAALAALASSAWSFLTTPYALSAFSAGALALALSYLLSAAPAPRDAKIRIVAGDVRRVAESAFVFRASSSSVPDLLFDGAQRSVLALHPKRRPTHPRSTSRPQQQSSNHPHPPSPVDPTPRLSIALPLRSGLFCRDDFREQHIADVDNLRVLEHGLHFHDGRAVAIAVGEASQDTLLHFKSRVASQTFLDVLNRFQSPREGRPSKVSLFLTTFNVGNAQPPDDLSPWLSQAHGADIVAIGSQECSYTATSTNSFAQPHDRLSRNRTASDSSPASESTKTLTEASPLLEAEDSSDDIVSIPNQQQPAQNGGTTSGKEHWQALLASHFPSDDYHCIAKLSAWDRCLTIFVKKKLLPSVSRVRHDTANVGLGGVAGNKGAIGARFSVFDTDFLLINSHLAAHHKEVNRRNEDFVSIASGLHGLRDDPEIDILTSPIHHTFWMGDLNYRINLEREKVLDLIEVKDWKQLQEADQLLQEMSAGRSFQGFQEGKTDFPPSYRYENGSRKYTAVKLRVPSYCDRILYRSLAGCELELQSYKPCDDIMTSDHSPVMATFTAALVHITGSRDVEAIAAEAGIQESRDLGLMSPMMSPRSLTMRALIPSGIGGFTTGSGAQLVFKSLSASDIPEMDHGGRRITVAKVLNIHNHVGWKKHDDLGEGRHADPYCTFHGNAVAELDEGVYRTRTVTASQNPVWETESIDGVDLISSEKSFLEGRYVVITVRDEVPTRRDDIIGSVVLRLGSNANGSLGSNDEPVPFELPIMMGGRQQGQLRGSYFVKRV